MHCGSAICALVDISALAIMILDPLLIRCRCILPLCSASCGSFAVDIAGTTAMELRP